MLRPHRCPPDPLMDALSDLLRVVRLDAAYFYPVEAAEPWSVESVGAPELAPRILPGAEHLIAYHVLTKGRCFAGIAGEPQVEMLNRKSTRLNSSHSQISYA